MKIAGIEIGAGQPCRFVAEISNNHNGDLGRALRLIDAAKAAGADFVKFQAYTPDELVTLRGDGPAPDPWGSQGWTMRRLYEKAQTPLEWFPKIAAHCERVGMPWFSSVFGPESLAVLEANGCPAYKIARLDNHSVPLVVAAGRMGKPLIVSSSTSSFVDAFTLWCPEGYPQSRFDLAGRFSYYEDTDDRFDGFSYHGTDPLPCIVAATLGAKLIEAHFQLDDEPSELEANVSLTASAFREMVDTVRRVEAIL